MRWRGTARCKPTRLRVSECSMCYVEAAPRTVGRWNAFAPMLRFLSLGVSFLPLSTTRGARDRGGKPQNDVEFIPTSTSTIPRSSRSNRQVATTRDRALIKTNFQFPLARPLHSSRLFCLSVPLLVDSTTMVRTNCRVCVYVGVFGCLWV
jgi:hypothetical protein